MGKKNEEQGLETFLKSEFLSELKNETPKGSKLIEKYPLNHHLVMQILYKIKIQEA